MFDFPRSWNTEQMKKRNTEGYSLYGLKMEAMLIGKLCDQTGMTYGAEDLFAEMNSSSACFWFVQAKGFQEELDD